MTMKPVVALFAKPPIPGETKTRLCPPLTPAQGANLYAAFLADIAEMLAAGANWDWMMYSTNLELQKEAWPAGSPKPDGWRQQRGANLGVRIERAFQEILGEGRNAAVILGSDHPTVTGELVAEAFAALESADIVLGPSLDGGYYLVGASAPPTGVFRDIPWSTEHVLERTLDRVEKAGLSVAFLHPWYDVDTGEDLRFLRVHLKALELAQPASAACLHTRRALARIPR